MRRIRKSVKRKIWFGVMVLGVQGLLVFGCQTIVRQMTVKKYESLLQEKEARIKAAGRTAYVTRNEIRAGELFTAENTERRYLLSEQNPEAISLTVLGRPALCDIPEGVIISTALCGNCEFVPSERKCLFYNIGFSECFEAYDAVDVRLRYVNGENYCVLKKKRLAEGATGDGAVSFYLTEEEQLLMSAAQYDVEVYEGAELYMVGFREENLQEDARSIYLPSMQILRQLCEWNGSYREQFTGFAESRSALEQRLKEYRQLLADGIL